MPAPPTPAASPNYLGELPPGARVAVIRLRSLGDCVLTTPALALLKAHRPDLSIAVVVEDRFAQIFEDNPDIDALLAPEVGALRAFQPAMAINFHGGTRSMKLLAASGARIRDRVRAPFRQFHLQREDPPRAGDPGRGASGPHR